MIRSLDNITLSWGSHKTAEDGMCLLEAVAWLAGEKHSDKPQCVCPVLAAFGRGLSDLLPDPDRTRLLLPFAARLIGTRSTPAVEQARAYLAADWAVRVCAPMALRTVGLETEAARLEALPVLDSPEACRAAVHAGAIAAARAADAAHAAAAHAAHAARAAAYAAAAYVAAYAAAYAADAVYAADAAADASCGVRAAVRAAARAAYAADAADAARAAADAADAAVTSVHASAIDLFARMIAVTA